VFGCVRLSRLGLAGDKSEMRCDMSLVARRAVGFIRRVLRAGERGEEKREQRVMSSLLL